MWRVSFIVIPGTDRHLSQFNVLSKILSQADIVSRNVCVSFQSRDAAAGPLITVKPNT